MLESILEKLKRKEVVVRANGLEYRGILIEATATELLIRRPTGYVSIPMDRISSLTDPSVKMKLDRRTSIDPSFYSFGDEGSEEPPTPGESGDPKKE